MINLKQYAFKGVLIAGCAMLVVGNAHAIRDYGNNIDSFCLDSDPFADDCSLCHTSNRSNPTPEKEAYLAGEWCTFCPSDSACNTGPVDADGDGYTADVDCDDNNAAVNPGATEICNDRVDNDCDGMTDARDPDCAITCIDADGDGFAVEGGLCNAIDCNDNNPDIFPGADDICNDGIDQDCSGADRTKGKGCKTTATRREGKGKTCNDFIDNDGDGATDCNDSDCSTNRACR